MVTDIVILAAGQGTRMRSNKPKVLHTIAGKPMVQHVLDQAKMLDNSRVHIVIGHGGDQVKEALAGQDINFIVQQEQLGTGHAVAQALPYLTQGGKVLVLYGDVPLTPSVIFKNLLAQVDEQQMALLTVNLVNPNGYGRIVRDEAGLVAAIVEQKDANDEQLKLQEINTGIMALTQPQLAKWLPKLSSENAQGEYYLTDVIAMASKSGVAIKTAQPDFEQEVKGVNNRQQQAELERWYQRQLAEQLMIEGASLADPTRIDIRGSLTVGRDCFIDINALFEGDVVLGDGVQIGPNCVIKNSTLGANTQVDANSVIDGASIAESCSIGPFARIRPDSELKAGSKVGNFVETKKSVIGPGAKINHLTYIGDANIGAKVNVGAGTITCNYDGVNKFKTVIGDGAFIGSNSSLVAPVSIGINAVVGAGSTITKDVEAGALAVGRGKQIAKAGWKK
ncbi:bifunctional UDP-N-acetylglucosamine diphosphorylase/glucosamine-1-phosphate N-acetyltransferase GlmU [Oceanospirillum linum]|uniref:Bifunctional protein GlmU n=1 Tax=Oceanospirillum linum TaxID=966 RepID=A0A1T1HBY2_OCELI|nr:bifunctional UDP-N-acetylglucosamine diphosphorylase/glucosamine-1-phosphate N-acetyltransferase GlmU [Oceanospirillum linum]OOV87349.1 UDP-N-acetylglucosamine diphosphorylase/glucosamine-1-phosphate N-acetyltransferase [Oceanospirillum linum]SEF82334.1 UDP-N-acetylglucosamine pyrophosphorylase /glucosamine-1-phosphate N-acetyltransferase [Oleiphilus messinensis]SMP19340.1 UDP-N-acetylglucosamine pyrophosphorylase /glucosamine-1-phosphate N-acetyltransferase [Oceanospirillum linum]